VADPAPAVPEGARAAILAWYDAHGRVLPFRATSDPFSVLVSETMAQQTQAERAGERWTSFIATWPTPAALAAASPADVLRAWRGLGYNRRGLNLWRAARAIVDDHGGVVPADVATLERLPGVGPYTARAVAAIAFGQPVGAVDTNTRRVVTRIAGAWGASPRTVQDLADSAVAPGRAADWTHAVMDVGARFCRPAAPRCGECPAAKWCRWQAAPGSAPPPAGRPRPPARPFPATSRWLRGRILDRLRAAEGAAWIAIESRIGAHEADAVVAALDGLARDGLLERHRDDPWRARLPVR
jgi:A/G-specific adenine glycosylase